MDDEVVNIILDEITPDENVFIKEAPLPVESEPKILTISENKLDHVTEVWTVFCLLSLISIGLPYLLYRYGRFRFRKH